MKTTYLRTEHTFFDTVIKIAGKKVIECNKDDILTSEISEDETHNEKASMYFSINGKCKVIEREEFDNFFIKTVEKINEISKL